MKNIITIILILSFFVSYGQNQSKTKFTTEIEKQILSKKVKKLESFKKDDWGYEKIIIYLKNTTPILIKKEVKEVTILTLTNDTEEYQVSFVSANFYITNWKENSFIRIGKRTFVNKDSTEHNFIMSNDYKFEFDRDEIKTLIKNGL